MKTILENSLIQANEDKKRVMKELENNFKKQYVEKVIGTYLDIKAVVASCLVKQGFWCKRGFHSSKEFYHLDNFDYVKNNYMIVCVDCGAIIVPYEGDGLKAGFVDPNKPFPFINKSKATKGELIS